MSQKHTCIAAIALASILAGCSEPTEPAPGIVAAVETMPVASTDDAADDPAIWVHPENANKSLILGTDKQAGLNIYKLDGSVHQFLPAGRLNNVDLRQGVTVGHFSGDLAAASNRTDDSITLFSVSYDATTEVGRFPATEVEPYGLCTGMMNGTYTIFVAYKSGNLVAYNLLELDQARIVASASFGGQLEGCVFDDDAQVLYVGEEEQGVWRINTNGTNFSKPTSIDTTGSKTGLRADAEGITLYKTGLTSGYLLVSSQGNNSYTVYDRENGNAFISRFSIVSNGDTENEIDGTEETDGIDAISTPLGAAFPAGIFVAQDGFNKPAGSTQNFKIVDWRKISPLLNGKNGS